MSDPLIVHWPKGIKARGEVRSQYAHVVDLTPTLLDVLGLEAPRILNGITQRPLEGKSFAHTFNDNEVATAKRTQYYEMIGSRAIWADGWKAVVEQPQGDFMTEEMLDAQKWELYNVENDFSESNNLAEKYPGKLKELIELWWIEAGKYNVLPLDSRMQLRMSERKPSTGSQGNRHTYYAGMAAQFEYTAVNLKNRSHTISADVVVPDCGAEGVLLAHGSWFAGYSLYVKDQRLTFVHNYLGLSEYRIQANQDLPKGNVKLQFRFVRTGEHQGRGYLFINGKQVGEAEIPRTIPAVIETSGEGLCCGYDSGVPVSPDYVAPFTFTGQIEQVVVETEEVGSIDLEAQIRTAFTDQ